MKREVQIVSDHWNSIMVENNLSKELNYLTRFLYYGQCGTISKAELCGAFPKSLDFCKKNYNKWMKLIL